MIRIARPKGIPTVLQSKGVAATTANCTAYASGARTFSFDAKIYGHRSVKNSLVKAQNGKCCFCESKVTHVSSGHIEHFRPKGGVRQDSSDSLQTPGYFWLAYEWTNLLFCCELCNSRFKKNLFPLLTPNSRARTPSDALVVEDHIFIDPASEDPTNHIQYREEYPFAVNGSHRGDATWRALGLDREQLAELRRDHLRTVKLLKKVRDGNYPASHRSEAAKLLAKFTSVKGQWSAMARAAMK